jgi:hypothetical protein
MARSAFSRIHLKNVFWPNIFVRASFQILGIPQYVSGFDPQKGFDREGSPAQRGKLGPAAILNQNPTFEMDSNYPFH